VFKLCNYNDEDIKFGNAGGSPSYFRFWHQENGIRIWDYDNENFQAPSMLLSRECVRSKKSKEVSSKIAIYNMDSHLLGPLVHSNGTNVQNGYCNAYSFNLIEFRYDYGDGDCVIHVSIFECHSNKCSL